MDLKGEDAPLEVGVFPSHSESYFAAVAEASTDVMRILELDGVVEFMNVRGRALLEIENFDVNHRKYWPDLWPEAARADLLAALDTARAGGTGRFRGFCPTAKGKPRWWDSVVSTVRDETGAVVRLLASSRDITYEVRREERLRKAAQKVRRANLEKARSLQYLKAAVEAMPAGLAFYNEDDRLTVWNQAYESASADHRAAGLAVGLRYQDLVERDVALGLYPEAAGREAEWVAECLAARSNFRTREQQLADGRWFRFDDRRLADGGVIATAVDISELKGRELQLAAQADELERARVQAEAASEAKSVFLANMSHEIRTPLNGVLAMSDILCRSGLPDRERELAAVVRSSAETLEHLVSEILDLARIEAGMIVLEQAPFHLGDAVRAVFAAARAKADEKKLAVNLVVDPAADGTVLGDATRVKQILTNLLSNAVKFTARGRIDVTVAVIEQNRFRVSVADTGIGFDPAQKARLFRRFEQADAGITRQFGGTGLGLAICEQLANAMGGAIDCEATSGEGSTFHVHLLLQAAPIEEDGVQAEAGPDGEGMVVLVVDDHAVNRQVADLILRQAGIETVMAEDGKQAVAAVQETGPDLVLMDIQMPGMDGFSAVREIRAWERQTGRARTPILMLSANALPQHAEEGRKSGADGHLSKPITADRLLSKVFSVLEEMRDSRQSAAR